MKIKVIVIMDSSNMGIINRLFEDGAIITYHPVKLKEEEHDPRKFVQEVRAIQHKKPNGHRHKVEGVNTLDCLVAILQVEPDAVMHKDDLATKLTEFGYQANTAPSSIHRLEEMGFVESPETYFWRLTQKGKDHKQSETIIYQGHHHE